MPTVSLTDEMIGTEIRSVIMQMIPGPEVVRAQINRVPEPLGDFIVFNFDSFVRLATNVDTYINAGPNNIANAQLSQQAQRLTVQIDCYGGQSYQWATILSTLLRSEYGCDLFVLGKPLFADDPKQLPLVNAEQQYQDRWMLQAIFQYNPTVSVPAQYPDVLGPVSIYPPVDYGPPPPIPPVTDYGVLWGDETQQVVWGTDSDLESWGPT